MPHVSVDYQLITTAGHHRRPRTTAASTILGTGPSGEYLPGTSADSGMAPPFPDTRFVFWSVSNTTTGQVSEAPSVTTTIGSTATKFTAWYVSTASGPTTTPGSVLLLDAFLANTGSFVDDPFVDVTSNPAISNTVDENGAIETTGTAVALHAHATCHGGAFVEWIGTGDPVGADLAAPADTDGFSIAVYRQDEVTLPRLTDLDALAWAILIGGITRDGGGIAVIGGRPHPVDPWGPMVGKALQALVSGRAGGQLGKDGIAIQQAAIATLTQLVKAQQAAVDKVAKGKIG